MRDCLDSIERITCLLHLTPSRPPACEGASEKVVAADAPRRGNGAADNHPLAARRFAPANQRMERTSVEASKLAPPSAAHPQPRYVG